MSLPYKIDGEPVSARRLIELAGSIDERFSRDWLKQTSVAARILRDNGHTVGENTAALAKAKREAP